ncbi:MAG TPA: HAD family phosphatase [Candidatus Saccharimonadales bacterium]
MPERPEAILFDADGTLYDSDHLHFEAYKQVASDLYGFDFTWELFRDHLLRGNKKAPQVLQDHGVDVNSEVFYKEKKRVYEYVAKEQLKPMPGLIEFLEWCHQVKIRRAIVSAATRASLSSSLAALRIQDSFEHIVSHEDIGNKRKPHPYPYLYGLGNLGIVASQAIAIEDTAKGIASARGAGLYCVGIWNQANNASEELVDADYTIKDYRELREHLE